MGSVASLEHWGASLIPSLAQRVKGSRLEATVALSCSSDLILGLETQYATGVAKKKSWIYFHEIYLKLNIPHYQNKTVAFYYVLSTRSKIFLNFVNILRIFLDCWLSHFYSNPQNL